MTCNYQEIFSSVDKLVSSKPLMHLYELVQMLGYSHPTIRKAVRENTNLSFKEYQQMMVLKVAHELLKNGRSIKYIGLSLGYSWPTNFSRFMNNSKWLRVSKNWESSSRELVDP
jgi:AraC-like DNA-binding protein